MPCSSFAVESLSNQKDVAGKKGNGMKGFMQDCYCADASRYMAARADL
ncbi:MAG: hypothetical protein K2H52_06390 [Lachnospiraceae bacterium]|nr:hypothetical protein [Lachnospiraceae bacterium]MDE6184854.1 hypothetical protein [Lachnospiraceae bacterium]